MTDLYPLKFHPIFKEKIWGGNKIKTYLGKEYSLSNCGESWELSGVSGNVSVVSEGSLKGRSLDELIAMYKGELVGEKIYEQYGNEFPLLIKFLDANEDLSIQVHPNDELAKERHNSFGKTEMWYILQADEGATLISGFNKNTDADEFKEKVEDGTLQEILNIERVNKGDTFFIPAGRVHTIGKGLLLAEIQQTSDVTYRIYDFDRVDKDGNKRELHIEESLDAINYEEIRDSKVLYRDDPQRVVPLVESQYFTTNKLMLTEDFTRKNDGEAKFRIIICTEGSGKLTYDGGEVSLKAGEVCLVPANIPSFVLSPAVPSVFLESYSS